MKSSRAIFVFLSVFVSLSACNEETASSNQDDCLTDCEDCPDSCSDTECSGCLIDDICYPAMVSDPHAICRICLPENTKSNWSDNDGAACDDGDFCNGADSCLAGLCSGHDGPPCSDDARCFEDEELCCTKNALLGCDEQKRVVWLDSCGYIFEIVEECNADTSHCLNAMCQCLTMRYDLDENEPGCEYSCQPSAYEPVSIMDSASDQIADTNCDGIEGDISLAVFVAPSPLGDDLLGDGTHQSPFESIHKAIEFAEDANKLQILIARGEYIIDQALKLPEIAIHGGYCPECTEQDGRYSPLGWLRGHGAEFETILLYLPQEGALPYALHCQNMGNAQVLLDRLNIIGADSSDGATGILASNSTLFLEGCRNVVLQDLTLVAGLAAHGFDGSSGQLIGSDGQEGTDGGAAIMSDTAMYCNNLVLAPVIGDGGYAVCGVVTGRGGPGGDSGKGGEDPGEGSSGISGNDGDSSSIGGIGGIPTSDINGKDGDNGAVGVNGSGGTQNDIFDVFSHFLLPASSGEDGTSGGCGAGGGGGSGGGGGVQNLKIEVSQCVNTSNCPDNCTDDADCESTGSSEECFSGTCMVRYHCATYGGAGAGGGSGASGGSPGTGGSGGGTSAAVVLWNSDLQLKGAVTLKSGRGGNGGQCGQGALGGTGGMGGIGGIWPSSGYRVGSSGGSGGTGGAGGPGGSGGGGGGGYSVGILSNTHFNNVISANDAIVIYDVFDATQGDRSGVGGSCSGGNSGSAGINRACFHLDSHTDCE